jgi:hypothetical protein
MPRARARELFRLGNDHWIAEEPGRPGLYHFWNDPRTGRTRRQSLGTENIEEAKVKLATVVYQGIPPADRTLVVALLERYFAERTDFLPSKDPARHAGRLFLECWGERIRFSNLGDQMVKEFIDWSVERGHSMPYVARNLSVLAAAVAHGGLKLNAPMKAGAILDKWPDLKEKPRRKLFEPTDDELARLLAGAMPENLRRWLLNSMATLGRPTAVLQLRPSQRDRHLGLIKLSVEGVRQNKKFRPTVREPEIMTKWLNQWEKNTDGVPMLPNQQYAQYKNRSSIHTVLARACGSSEAGLPSMALYSIRHRGTTVLRAAKVPKEQIDYQLGHVQRWSE